MKFIFQRQPIFIFLLEWINVLYSISKYQFQFRLRVQFFLSFFIEDIFFSFLHVLLNSSKILEKINKHFSI